MNRQSLQKLEERGNMITSRATEEPLGSGYMYSILVKSEHYNGPDETVQSTKKGICVSFNRKVANRENVANPQVPHTAHFSTRNPLFR